MATAPLTLSGLPQNTIRTSSWLPSTKVFSSVGVLGLGLKGRNLPNLVVRAATVVPLKYASIKPVGDRVLVKIKSPEEKTTGGILLPSSAQSRSQAGEVVSIGDGRIVGQNKVGIDVEVGNKIVYSKYAGTELKFNGSNYLLLKEDDIVGILDTCDAKDLRPLNDCILIKVAEPEEKTAGGLLLTPSAQDKPSTGTVITVGPGPLNDEGKRKPLSLRPGDIVLYSKFTGSELKSSDGSDYIIVRASDVLVVLSS